MKPRYISVAILAIILVLNVGCAAFNPQSAMKNQVRLAVYEYEREARGLANDLVIHFQRTEPKIKFEGQNQNGGRTVWLFTLAAKEYFDLLPPERTYLYIQQIEFNDDLTQAIVPVYRGDGAGYAGRTLTLAQGADGVWSVTDEEAIE